MSDAMSEGEILRAIHEGKCLAEIMAEQLVLAAAQPGLNKVDQLQRRYNRDIGVVVCGAIATGETPHFAAAAVAVSSAMAILALDSKDASVFIDHLCANAKAVHAEAYARHALLKAKGFGLATRYSVRG